MVFLVVFDRQILVAFSGDVGDRFLNCGPEFVEVCPD